MLSPANSHIPHHTVLPGSKHHSLCLIPPALFVQPAVRK